MKRSLFALVAALSLTSTAQAANLITNGGFEDPVITSGFVNFVAPSTGITGWTVQTNSVDIVSNTFGAPAFEGTQFLDLVGFGSTGGVAQSIATVAGTRYKLSFAYSHNSFGGLSSASADVTVAGIGSLLATSITHSTGSPPNLDWKLFSGSFVADAPTALLLFNETSGGGNAGVLFDAVSISAAVPEAATWAMMIAGFGLVGAATRRRRSGLAVAA
jgi:hypothetical protein